MNREQLLQRLRDEDEVVVLELLQLTSDKLVDAFIDDIEENAERLIQIYEEEL
jgi:hypothetical protein